MNAENTLLEITTIVVDNLKQEAKKWANKRTINWVGDAHLSKTDLKRALYMRDKRREGSELLIKGLKLLGW